MKFLNTRCFTIPRIHTIPIILLILLYFELTSYNPHILLNDNRQRDGENNLFVIKSFVYEKSKRLEFT